MFRKQAAAPVDDDIPEDALAAIPDLPEIPRAQAEPRAPAGKPPAAIPGNPFAESATLAASPPVPPPAQPRPRTFRGSPSVPSQAVEDVPATGPWTSPLMHRPGEPEGAPAPGRGAAAPLPAAHQDTPEDFQAMVTELRESMHAAFSREMDSVERSFLGGLRDIQERLMRAEAHAQRLAAENAQILQQRAEMAKKVAAIKQLTQAIDEL